MAPKAGVENFVGHKMDVVKIIIKFAVFCACISPLPIHGLEDVVLIIKYFTDLVSGGHLRSQKKGDEVEEADEEAQLANKNAATTSWVNLTLMAWNELETCL